MSVNVIHGVESAFQVVVKTAGNAYSFINAYKSQALNVMKEGAVPFKAVSIVGYSVLSVFEIGLNARMAVKMKGRYKVIPSLKILASAGDLIGEVGKGLLLVASKTPHLLKALQFASTTLGVASIALQVFGLAANIWESVSVRKQIREFDAIKKDNPYLALSGMRSKLGDRKIFRIVSKKQSRLIKTILQKESPISFRVIQTAKVIEKHARSARAIQIVKTVMNILMVLGLVLLLFTPTPFAPILLGGMMLTMGVSFFAMIASSVQSSRCSHKLKKLAA
jgi:hypothetical protein